MMCFYWSTYFVRFWAFVIDGNWWQILASDGNFWQLLVTDGNFWQLRATFGNCCCCRCCCCSFSFSSPFVRAYLWSFSGNFFISIQVTALPNVCPLFPLSNSHNFHIFACWFMSKSCILEMCLQRNESLAFSLDCNMQPFHWNKSPQEDQTLIKSLFWEWLPRPIDYQMYTLYCIALCGSCNGNLDIGFCNFLERNLSGIFGHG